MEVSSRTPIEDASALLELVEDTLLQSEGKKVNLRGLALVVKNCRDILARAPKQTAAATVPATAERSNTGQVSKTLASRIRRLPESFAAEDASTSYWQSSD